MSCEFFDGTDGAEINTEEQKKEEQRKKHLMAFAPASGQS